jgi:DNA-binding response OmpR family regulator
MEKDSAIDPPTPNGPSQIRRARILFVDDQPELFARLAVVLEDEYEVHIVASAEDALKLALSDPPDLIGADVVMPGMNGVELLKTLRSVARTRLIPVILISGQDPDKVRLQAFESGADAYLCKPFTLSELRAQIHLSLQGRAHFGQVTPTWR